MDQCNFESLNEPSCGEPATEELTVAFVVDGHPESETTYKVCARHKQAVLDDIADTEWEVVG